jgi:hypothetical protein
MSKFTLEQLTEGIRERHIGSESNSLVEKWSRTGLLRGLNKTKRENMARLLENQAMQLLRETSSLSGGGGNVASSGDLRGFSNIAFPIVRRVFGGLVANELVSIQPMSLPSGLLFYLDYTYGTNVGGDANLMTGAAPTAATFATNQSIYNNPVGSGVRSGSLGTGGQYDLVGTSYSKVHSSSVFPVTNIRASGSWAGGNTLTAAASMHATGTDGQLIMFDPQISNLIEVDTADGTPADGLGEFQFLILNLAAFGANTDLTMVKDFTLFSDQVALAGLAPLPQTIQGGNNVLNVRRLNTLGTYVGGMFTANPYVTPATTNGSLLLVVSGTYIPDLDSAMEGHLTCSHVIAAGLDVDNDASALTIPTFESDFATQPTPAIPEIDIKIESISVTAQTRKLRARWSPELAQDLNAYHSLDAEVELTQILSEQVALEIDREILGDLLHEAQGATFYWSRAPGKFVNKETGAQVTLASSLHVGPQFTGTVREWYETLIETIIDVANQIHRKTLRGSANFIVTSPDICTILEASVLYKPALSIDGMGQVGAPFSIGAEAVGTLSNRFTVYKDPYFPRQKILVGYKGGSYLETGYVYAPYVPLIVTPTIFAPEDFTPRKGVMTRYGKKMVRADFYGTVTVMDLNII